MYNKKVVKNACKAAIDLSKDYTFDNNPTRSCIYHLVKLARVSAKEFIETDDELREMFDTLGVYAAKLKRIPNLKIIQGQYVLTYDDEKVKIPVPTPMSNAHNSVIRLIRNSLNNRTKDDYVRLYDISNLYVQKLFQYSDWLQVHESIEKYDMINGLLWALVSEIWRHTYWLENAMNFEHIKYDEILM
ncbi:MAG: hypothetical protein NC085_12060 [Muribaculaceae bacterium]|nr:hypothetical protein [Muribaculaceae bacterium]